MFDTKEEMQGIAKELGITSSLDLEWEKFLALRRLVDMTCERLNLTGSARRTIGWTIFAAGWIGEAPTEDAIRATVTRFGVETSGPKLEIVK